MSDPCGNCDSKCCEGEHGVNYFDSFASLHSAYLAEKKRADEAEKCRTRLIQRYSLERETDQIGRTNLHMEYLAQKRRAEEAEYRCRDLESERDELSSRIDSQDLKKKLFPTTEFMRCPFCEEGINPETGLPCPYCEGESVLTSSDVEDIVEQNEAHKAQIQALTNMIKDLITNPIISGMSARIRDDARERGVLDPYECTKYLFDIK